MFFFSFFLLWNCFAAADYFDSVTLFGYSVIFRSFFVPTCISFHSISEYKIPCTMNPDHLLWFINDWKRLRSKMIQLIFEVCLFISSWEVNEMNSLKVDMSCIDFGKTSKYSFKRLLDSWKCHKIIITCNDL